MGRQLFLTIASVFLAYQSVKLILVIPEVEGQDFTWWVDILLGMVALIMLTGVFAFVGFAWPTRRLLPQSYYTVRHPAQLAKWNNRFGVSTYTKLLLGSVWRSKDRRAGFFDGTRAGIQGFISASQQAEFGHLLAGIVCLAVAVYTTSYGHYTAALALAIGSIPLNLYPILLQRKHRSRVARLRDRYGP